MRVHRPRGASSLGPTSHLTGTVPRSRQRRTSLPPVTIRPTLRARPRFIRGMPVSRAMAASAAWCLIARFLAKPPVDSLGDGGLAGGGIRLPAFRTGRSTTGAPGPRLIPEPPGRVRPANPTAPAPPGPTAGTVCNVLLAGSACGEERSGILAAESILRRSEPGPERLPRSDLPGRRSHTRSPSPSRLRSADNSIAREGSSMHCRPNARRTPRGREEVFRLVESGLTITAACGATVCARLRRGFRATAWSDSERRLVAAARVNFEGSPYIE
jgi:hypothetical protein